MPLPPLPLSTQRAEAATSDHQSSWNVGARSAGYEFFVPRTRTCNKFIEKLHQPAQGTTRSFSPAILQCERVCTSARSSLSRHPFPLLSQHISKCRMPSSSSQLPRLLRSQHRNSKMYAVVERERERVETEGNQPRVPLCELV